MRSVEPTIATVIQNPTNRDLKYTWAGKGGMFVKAGGTVTVPYDVYTAANPAQRAALGNALKSKMVKLTYKVRKPAKAQSVDSISQYVERDDVPSSRAIPPVNKAEELAKKAAEEEAAKKEAEAKEKKKEPRKEIIREVGDGKDANKDSKDIVQKATGQETVSMKEALGWDEPDTDDTREDQEIDDVKMEDALSENIGDNAAKKEAEAKAKEEAEKAVAEKKKKRREAAKKAAKTRRANRAKKKAEEEE
jgi:hypothetical protein